MEKLEVDIEKKRWFEVVLTAFYWRLNQNWIWGSVLFSKWGCKAFAFSRTTLSPLFTCWLPIRWLHVDLPTCVFGVSMSLEMITPSSIFSTGSKTLFDNQCWLLVWWFGSCHRTGFFPSEHHPLSCFFMPHFSKTSVISGNGLKLSTRPLTSSNSLFSPNRNSKTSSLSAFFWISHCQPNNSNWNPYINPIPTIILVVRCNTLLRWDYLASFLLKLILVWKSGQNSWG